MKKLNSHGFAHHFALALAVVGIITAFTFQAVAGHAQVPNEGNDTTRSTTVKTSTASNCTAQLPLKVGSKGSCVVYLQKKIGATADGSFGPGTKAKVIAFQTNHGLTADGIVGKMTWAKVTGASTPAASSATPAAAPAKSKTPAKSQYAFKCRMTPLTVSQVNHIHDASNAPITAIFANTGSKAVNAGNTYSSINPNVSIVYTFHYLEPVRVDGKRVFKERIQTFTDASPGAIGTYAGVIIDPGHTLKWTAQFTPVTVMSPGNKHPGYTFSVKATMVNGDSGKALKGNSCSSSVHIPKVTTGSDIYYY